MSNLSNFQAKEREGAFHGPMQNKGQQLESSSLSLEPPESSTDTMLEQIKMAQSDNQCLAYPPPSANSVDLSQEIEDPNEVNLNREGVKAYKFGDSTMTPFTSGSETLSQAGKNMDKSGTTEYSINAQFLEGGFLSGYNNQGKSYANGVSLGGSSQREWYHLAQDKAGNYTFGKGDPSSKSHSAVGGGRPLIFDGLPYGAENKYQDNAPKGLPTVGDPGAENRKYLTQRSAAYFLAQNGVEKGKSIVAHNPKTDEIMIIVQEDGEEGYSMDAYRDYLVGKGFTNALSFDGSDSALLIKDKDELIDNGWRKDKYTDSGITFSVPEPK